MTKKNEIMQPITFHELIRKRKATMDQFCHGLERSQVLECIRKNPTVFKQVFVYMEEQEPFIGVFEIDKSIANE